MDTATNAPVTTTTPSLYFCPVCGKPSTQESSFTRHVQYCKRRAATKRTTRPRACRHCRATKSKCDAQWPCSRCTSKNKECIYDKSWPITPQDVSGSTATATATATVKAAATAAAMTTTTATEEESQQCTSGGCPDAGTLSSSVSSSSASSDVAAGSSSNSPAASDKTSISGHSGCQESCCSDLADAPPFTTVDSCVNIDTTMNLAVTTPSTLATTIATTLATTATSAAPMVLDPAFSSATAGITGFSIPPGMNMYDLGSFAHIGGLSLPQQSSLSTMNMPSPIGLHMPYAPPPDPIMEISDGVSDSPASADLRRLIVSMLRTFPRMMTRPGSMPPFIHRVGCGLHYENVDVEGTFPAAIKDGATSSASASSSSALFAPVYGRAVQDTSDTSLSTTTAHQTVLFTPLPIMAACVGISHAFVTRSAHSDEFLWRSIDKEHKTIVNNLRLMSFGEIFVAIQAISIYTTMRLVVYGREYFHSDMSLLDTMGKLSERFHELWHGPFMPSHDEDRGLVRSERPRWEDWIFDETRRRITATCWLMSLAVNPRAQSYRLSKPQRFPLPSSRRLWEAESQAAWEREYDNDQFEKHILVQSAARSFNSKNGPPHKLGMTTVGDLSRAIDRAVADEGSFGLPSNEALYEDDLLAYWHAGVDSLGMMVTAAAAQHAFEP